MARPKSTRKTKNTKIWEEALDSARIASGFTGDTLVDFISKCVIESADRVIDDGYARRKEKKTLVENETKK